MKPRLNPQRVVPELVQAMIEFGTKANGAGLEHSLCELVKIRASQINGCAFCLHMHTREARAAGESEERIYLLDAWRESPLYTDRERAALAWTEVLTLVAETHAPDEDYDRLKNEFSEEEIGKLTMLVMAINSWNRLAIAFRSVHPVKKVSAVA